MSAWSVLTLLALGTSAQANGLEQLPGFSEYQQNLSPSAQVSQARGERGFEFVAPSTRGSSTSGLQDASLLQGAPESWFGDGLLPLLSGSENSLLVESAILLQRLYGVEEPVSEPQDPLAVGPPTAADFANLEPITLEPRLSSARQSLSATIETVIPLDPNQLNITADVLDYDPEQNVGIAAGNARIQLFDGSVITGDRFLFYRDQERLVSEGPFRMSQRLNGGERQIEGENLDLHIPSRSATFENSFVRVPAEEPGTFVFIRSERTSGMLNENMMFDGATMSTSPEPPITNYVRGNRIEVYPDDQIIIRDAHAFLGGRLDEETNSLYGGVRVAYFPLFVYSLRAHQWILPGQSQEEGFFVKSSWAYRFNQYNFGGIRFDLLSNKGIGLGFVHDYILPIANSNNFGRAQFYLVTEADQDRLSSRFRLDHYYTFYQAVLFGNRGQLSGQLYVNVDNTYRPAGGRNDNADFRLNSVFSTQLSTTTLNVSRTASQERGFYNLPILLNHSQRFEGINWLSADLRLNYNQNRLALDLDPTSSTRLELGLQAFVWGGSQRLTYRGHSSSGGDLEARRNVELNLTPPAIPILGTTLNTSVNAVRSQIPNPDDQTFLQFYDEYDFRANIYFNSLRLGSIAEFHPGSINYEQVLYSTGDQESVVFVNPRLYFQPVPWASLDAAYTRTFVGNNSVPFSSISRTSETNRLNFALSMSNAQAAVIAPPGYIAFEDDFPGELPIALIFEDDDDAEVEAIAQAEQEALTSEIRHSLRFDATTGFDYMREQWDSLTASFTWNTAPQLFDLRLSSSYDLNRGQLQPVTLEFAQRSSTTFDRNRRSGLDTYEPGISYGLRVIYDPLEGRVTRYSFDWDMTIGTRWQDHWRIRLGLDQAGLNRIEVRRDLRDFELRFSYEPQAQQFRFESILVAFPSRPVGISQQRGQFALDSPLPSLSYDNLFP